jgi:FAD/FMN-containing dehydrogenase
MHASNEVLLADGRSANALTSDLVRELQQRTFAGELIDRGRSSYDDARRVWSGSIDRQPLAIARCHDANDVAAAILASAALGLSIAVRGGGHSAAGHSTCDDGLVIDLSPMRQVRVDPDARLARVAGGALLSDLDTATQQHGLAVPAGQVSHTGVAGLTLGGGLGYLMRKYGLTIDSLKGAEVVTADGETVWATEEQHEDLFWALRGGGGNFGVVTEFLFQLHEVGPLVHAGVLVYPLDRGAEVLRASRDVMEGASEDLTIYEVLMRVPAHDPFPQELQGKPAVLLTPVHLGTETEAEADLAAFRALAPAFDLVGPMPYVALQSMIDYDNRAGRGHYSKSHWLSGFPDQLIDTLVDALPAAPSSFAHLITARMGGAIERVPPGATAFTNRSAANLLWILNNWDDSTADDQAHRQWVNDVIAATSQYSTGGGYVNAVSHDDGSVRARSAYDPEAFSRLSRIKRQWDPDNVFRLNANVPPAGAG